MDIASSNKQMWRGALSASLVATVIAIVFFTIYLGAPGFFGSALASFVVLIFFFRFNPRWDIKQELRSDFSNGPCPNVLFHQALTNCPLSNCGHAFKRA